MSTSDGPVRLSQMVGSPTFRSSAVNAVAVIPLLSSSNDGRDDPTTHSSKSFEDFMRSLHRHNRGSDSDSYETNSNTNGNKSNVVVVVPNSNLTRPSDWKYNETPLRNFHWGHGCQRLRFFDGRPYHSRSAHDRLINHELTRNWIDLCPSRRTAALIGVLNVRDCPDPATLDKAIFEWRQWAERYSTPPYEVTAHGRDVGRDTVVPRIFVFDSFHEDVVNNSSVDLKEATQRLGLTNSSLVAFPPAERSNMMDLHMNVVVNDLAVAVFRELEEKVRESDALRKGPGSTAAQPQAGSGRKGFFGRSTSKTIDEESPMGSRMLSIENLAAVVSPTNELASTKARSNNSNNFSNHGTNDNLSSASHHSGKDAASVASTASGGTNTTNTTHTNSSVKAQLLTPLDEVFEVSELSPKDAHMMTKREVARREKFTADLCLLAGSPLDAYERYTRAADLCKTTSPDPLWYASALEGCATVHIAMADVGGFNVDEYLDSSFQLTEELMACAVVSASDASAAGDKDSKKKSLPQVVVALCEDALNVTARHPKTTCFHAELLLKMAWYTAELEDVHVRCRWGLGGNNDHDDDDDDCCYGGDPNHDKRRWEMASATRLNFLELKNKEGEDVTQVNTLRRCQKCSEFMHRAASVSALDSASRTDVALRCLAIAWKGVRPTIKPTEKGRSNDRIQMKRKAAFFAVTAAEAMSDVYDAEKANAMWMQASSFLSRTPNELAGGSYAWATLRAVALHALILQGMKESSEEAATELLRLVSQIAPPYRGDATARRETLTKGDDAEGSQRSYSFAGARSYISASAKSVSTRSKGFFGNVNDMSSLLAVQSKWVEDEPLPPKHVPMGVYSSDFALRVLELPSVWSTISHEHCSVAQERLLHEICDLRKKIPVSTSQKTENGNEELPITITSICIMSPDSSLKLERMELKPKGNPDKPKDHSMATFFNPYAKKKPKVKPTTIPRGEEHNLSINFSNKLSIPFDVDSCKLVFDTSKSGNIKAPSISFTVPGQIKDYAVRFPFIVLDKLGENETDDDIDTLEVKGIYITALSRSFFLPLGEDTEKEDGNEDEPIIPDTSSLYPRRDYSKTTRQDDQRSKAILSPRLEITPPQPSLRFSFASSPTPMDDDTIIPVLIADGELFSLPKICISNDMGTGGYGTIEELQISVVGVPGRSQVILYDMSSSQTTKDKPEDSSSVETSDILTISADCVGMDAETLNAPSDDSLTAQSYVAVKLLASSNMGAKTSECEVTLRFRYRGRAVSPLLEVWRKYEVNVKILRVKGPRIPSLSFRCDLLWDSGYADLCHALAAEEDTQREPKVPYEPSVLAVASGKDFAANRLGRDPGIHVCGEKVVLMLSVANESASPIVVSRVDGSPIGFPNRQMDSLRISKGVSAKFPIVLPRINRSGDVARTLIDMTKLRWRSDIPKTTPDDAQETGGPMFPANYRVRQGFLELPFSCLASIIEKNPIFLSRMCQAPCSLSVVVGSADTKVGIPVDVSVGVKLSEWLSAELTKRTRFVLTFYCSRQKSAAAAANHDAGVENVIVDLDNASKSDKENRDRWNHHPTTRQRRNNREFVWIGQTRKTLLLGTTDGEIKDDDDAAAVYRAKILILEEGEYYVSACITMSARGTATTDEVNNDDTTKEVWWADKAAKLHVSSRQKQ